MYIIHFFLHTNNNIKVVLCRRQVDLAADESGTIK